MPVRCWVISCLLLNVSCAASASSAEVRFDQHGFPLPEGAIARLGDLHYAQPSSITALALSCDGKIIASAGDGIYLWDADTGLITRKIVAAGFVNHLAFSSDGALLAGATNEGAITVWNTATGVLHRKHEAEEKWQGEVSAIRFIDNNRFLAVAQSGRDTSRQSRRQPRLQLWEVAKGTLHRTWEARVQQPTSKSLGDQLFTSVALSPSGEQMAWLTPTKREGDADRCAVFIHETVSGRLLHEVKDLLGPANQVSFCNEGNHVLLDRSTFLQKNTVVAVKDGHSRFSLNIEWRAGLAGL